MVGTDSINAIGIRGGGLDGCSGVHMSWCVYLGVHVCCHMSNAYALHIEHIISIALHSIRHWPARMAQRACFGPVISRRDGQVPGGIASSSSTS